MSTSLIVKGWSRTNSRLSNIPELLMGPSSLNCKGNLATTNAGNFGWRPENLWQKGLLKVPVRALALRLPSQRT